MSVVDRARSLDELWQVQQVLATDGPGLGMPLRLLEGIRTMLHCDNVSCNELDSVHRRHHLMQDAEADWRDEIVPSPQDEDPTFWQHYWDGPCSFPERKGTTGGVLVQSEIISQRRWHQQPLYVEGEAGQRIEHEMMALWPGRGPGRTFRLLCFRYSGPDFDDDDRFLLELLRPHLIAAFHAADLERARLSGNGVAALTPRQVQVLTMAAEGMTNHAIGHRLGISEGTVRTHLQNIYATLHVSSRTAAARCLAEVPTGLRVAAS